MQNCIDQKKQKLKSLEKEDDLDTRMAGLIYQFAKYNENHFKCVMKFKIRELEVNFKINENLLFKQQCIMKIINMEFVIVKRNFQLPRGTQSRLLCLLLNLERNFLREYHRNDF
ncbi:uncharacterized protein LOC133830573 isoform X2 [Humulus lupulus]|uniref:uncharacterized protein LOC133830573 isoform X2 n=1 Tax=Humulus lupulus TaxID=3486 RepID=UPI002B411AE8|nr:uncharacterized protein LOC133830573 isoform X2 [Humulus lupulus]